MLRLRQRFYDNFIRAEYTNELLNFSIYLFLLDQRSVIYILADPLVGSIAQQYITDKEQHDATAKEWTRRYAT